MSGLPDTLTINVLQSDIDRATPCDSELCPIAQAIWDEYKPVLRSLGVSGGVILLYPKHESGDRKVAYKTTRELDAFMQAFDAGEKVLPTTFTVERGTFNTATWGWEEC